MAACANSSPATSCSPPRRFAHPRRPSFRAASARSRWGPTNSPRGCERRAEMPIFLYIGRATFIHRLHPPVKVFALFVMFWSVYWVDHPLALLPLGLVMLALAAFTGAWPPFYPLPWRFILGYLPTSLPRI